MSLTRKTKTEIFELLKKTAQDKYPDADWTGLQTGSMEWLMALLVAEASDLNGLYLDLRANNAYISSATVRKDIRDIASNLGLILRERSGATTTLSITATNDVTIPKGTAFSTSNGTIFSTLNALALSTSTSLTGTIQALNSEYTTRTFNALGNAGEVIELSVSNIIPGHLTVTVDSVEWSQVDTFSSSTGSSQHYIIDFDEQNNVSIKFGDGVYGARIGADATIVVDIYSGGGPGGNGVAVGAVTSLNGTFTNSSNLSTITNTNISSGGGGAAGLDEIRAAIPAQLQTVTGILSADNISSVLGASLAWLADATAIKGHTQINSVYVPQTTVYAYPRASAIQDLSAAQSSELSTLLSNRGELGVSWSVADAYSAPVGLEFEVRLANRNLQAETTEQIKDVLNTNTSALWAFSNIGFDKEYTLQAILDAVESVDNVVRARVGKFYKIPQPIVLSGASTSADWAADIELGPQAEDGYYLIQASDTQNASVKFMRPIKPDTIGASFVRSDDSQFIEEEYSFALGSELNDTDGPYVKINGSSKIEFKQNTNVWVNDQFNGTGRFDKYILRVQYVDSVGVTNTSYYHIADTIAPNVLNTTENSNAPIGGDSLTATLADSANTNIKVQILKDQTFGGTGTLLTPNETSFGISYNDANTLYLDRDPSGLIGVGEYSYTAFNDTALDTSTNNYISSESDLKIRIYSGAASMTAGDKIGIWTSAVKSDRLSPKNKHISEVFVLNDANIIIRYL